MGMVMSLWEMVRGMVTFLWGMVMGMVTSQKEM